MKGAADANDWRPDPNIHRREWDHCPDCDHLRALHGFYGCSACDCRRWEL